MKTTSLTSLAVLTCSIIAWAAPEDAAPSQPLKIHPKNLARQHSGANLFLFNPANQTYAPTEAAAAWLDDDVTTGWPVMAGKQHYLLSLAEAQLLNNFAVSTRSTPGTMSIYAGDEPAPPSAASWTPLAKDVPLDSVNHAKLAKPFSRFAKYLLIETDLADPGPLFSLYVYGDRPAISYKLQKREQPIDTKAIFGFANSQTAINSAGLHANGRVAHANSGDGYMAWQKAIDDNPGSALTIAPSTDVSGAVVKFGATRSTSRLAVLTDATSKGKLEFYLVPETPAEATVAAPGTASDITPVSNTTSAPGTLLSEAVPLEGLTPAATMVLDGANSRSSIDLPSTQASTLLVRWTPDNGTDPIAIRELNAFGDLVLSDYDLSLSPEAVAELSGDPSKDGKSFKSFKDGKGLPEEVAELLPRTAQPYLPGSLGFPPIITGQPEPLSP